MTPTATKGSAKTKSSQNEIKALKLALEIANSEALRQKEGREADRIIAELRLEVERSAKSAMAAALEPLPANVTRRSRSRTSVPQRQSLLQKREEGKQKYSYYGTPVNPTFGQMNPMHDDNGGGYVYNNYSTPVRVGPMLMTPTNMEKNAYAVPSVPDADVGAANNPNGNKPQPPPPPPGDGDKQPGKPPAEPPRKPKPTPGPGPNPSEPPRPPMNPRPNLPVPPPGGDPPPDSSDSDSNSPKPNPKKEEEEEYKRKRAWLERIRKSMKGRGMPGYVDASSVLSQQGARIHLLSQETEFKEEDYLKDLAVLSIVNF